MKMNPATAIDFYKADHISQYPKGTQRVYSNMTPRSDRLANVLRHRWQGKVVNFGLQGFIKWYLMDLWDEGFFNVKKDIAIGQIKRRFDNALGKDAVSVKHFEDLHDLGYLPIEIKALPEGARVNMKVPLFTVVNTEDHEEFFWLVNYLETALSNGTWKAITNATIAFEYRRLLDKYAAKTGGSPEAVLFQGHDFSCRGLGGMYDAASSSSGHLLSFWGTDTVSAIDYVEEYYNADSDSEPVGFSVPATEHSVTCSSIADAEIALKESGEWCGIKLKDLIDESVPAQLNYQKLAEKAFIKRMVTQTYPSGIVSLVADSFDFWRVISEIAPELEDDILGRQPNDMGQAKVVFRPDSGNPVDVLCGVEINTLDPQYTPDELEAWKSYVAEYMDDVFRANLDAESPHDHETSMFRFKDTVYRVVYTPDLNRHDKQYYYVDNFGSTVDKCEFESITLSPEQKGAVEVLWDTFGGEINDKGYKVLNDRVGLIYGDSITLERAEEILKRLETKGFASTNVVFGIGSYTYQYNTRDTFGMAMKATYGEVNGEGREIFKDPATDNGIKKSAKGLLRVEYVNGNYVLYDQQTPDQERQGELRTVFKNGELIVDQSLGQIRDRLLSSVV